MRKPWVKSQNAALVSEAMLIESLDDPGGMHMYMHMYVHPPYQNPGQTEDPRLHVW